MKKDSNAHQQRALRRLVRFYKPKLPTMSGKGHGRPRATHRTSSRRQSFSSCEDSSKDSLPSCPEIKRSTKEKRNSKTKLHEKYPNKNNKSEKIEDKQVIVDSESQQLNNQTELIDDANSEQNSEEKEAKKPRKKRISRALFRHDKIDFIKPKKQQMLQKAFSMQFKKLVDKSKEIYTKNDNKQDEDDEETEENNYKNENSPPEIKIHEEFCSTKSQESFTIPIKQELNDKETQVHINKLDMPTLDLPKNTIPIPFNVSPTFITRLRNNNTEISKYPLNNNKTAQNIDTSNNNNLEDSNAQPSLDNTVNLRHKIVTSDTQMPVVPPPETQHEQKNDKNLQHVDVNRQIGLNDNSNTEKLKYPFYGIIPNSKQNTESKEITMHHDQHIQVPIRMEFVQNETNFQNKVNSNKKSSKPPAYFPVENHLITSHQQNISDNKHIDYIVSNIDKCNPTSLEIQQRCPPINQNSINPNQFCHIVTNNQQRVSTISNAHQNVPNINIANPNKFNHNVLENQQKITSAHQNVNTSNRQRMQPLPNADQNKFNPILLDNQQRVPPIPVIHQNVPIYNPLYFHIPNHNNLNPILSKNQQITANHLIPIHPHITINNSENNNYNPISLEAQLKQPPPLFQRNVGIPNHPVPNNINYSQESLKNNPLNPNRFNTKPENIQIATTQSNIHNFNHNRLNLNVENQQRILHGENITINNPNSRKSVSNNPKCLNTDENNQLLLQQMYMAQMAPYLYPNTFLPPYFIPPHNPMLHPQNFVPPALENNQIWNMQANMPQTSVENQQLNNKTADIQKENDSLKNNNLNKQPIADSEEKCGTKRKRTQSVSNTERNRKSPCLELNKKPLPVENSLINASKIVKTKEQAQNSTIKKLLVTIPSVIKANIASKSIESVVASLHSRKTPEPIKKLAKANIKLDINDDLKKSPNQNTEEVISVIKFPEKGKVVQNKPQHLIENILSHKCSNEILKDKIQIADENTLSKIQHESKEKSKDQEANNNKINLKSEKVKILNMITIPAKNKNEINSHSESKQNSNIIISNVQPSDNKNSMNQQNLQMKTKFSLRGILKKPKEHFHCHELETYEDKSNHTASKITKRRNTISHIDLIDDTEDNKTYVPRKIIERRKTITDELSLCETCTKKNNLQKQPKCFDNPTNVSTLVKSNNVDIPSVPVNLSLKNIQPIFQTQNRESCIKFNENHKNHLTIQQNKKHNKSNIEKSSSHSNAVDLTQKQKSSFVIRYIKNETEYEEYLKLLKEKKAIGPYLFYKFITDIQRKNKEPIINLISFFCLLKSGKLTRYKEMYNQCNKK